MRIKYLIPALLILFLIPVAAMAVSQDTLDNLEFLLQQTDWDFWDDGVFDDDILLEGFEIIYDNALEDEDDIMVRKVIWAMGETGFTDFVPTLLETMESEPVVVCYALGKIPSEDGVNALIEELDNEDEQVRDAAVWGLGSCPYTEEMEEVKDDATEALYARLDVEEEDWVLEDIDAAITLLETGIITSNAFITDIEE